MPGGIQLYTARELLYGRFEELIRAQHPDQLPHEEMRKRRKKSSQSGGVTTITDDERAVYAQWWDLVRHAEMPWLDRDDEQKQRAAVP